MKKLSFICIAALLSCTSAFAGSFHLWNQTGRSVGNAMAGEGAIANDASTAWYNAAGLTQLKHQEVAVSAVGFWQYTKFRGTVTSNGSALTGTSSYHKFSVMPTLQYGAPLNDKWAFGLSLNSPFGAAVKFDRDDQIRYAVIENDIAAYDIAPSIAYKINPHFSIGAGPDIVHAYAKLESSTYLGEGNEQISTNEASEWKVGYHLSALWNINPTTRVGFNYRSKFVIHADGDSKFGSFPKRDLKARAVLPPVWTISGFHQLNKTWDLLGTISYIQWGQFDYLTLDNLSPSGSRIDRPQNHDNAWLFSAGANYHLNPKWTLRGALGYDQTATKEDRVNPTSPDNDRIVLALGAGYRYNKHLTLNAGLTHFFIKKASSEMTKPDAGETWTANGKIWQHVNIIGLQANWQFS